MSTRVTFRFPHDVFVRYEDRIPVRGEGVHDLRGRLFAVERTEPDGAGGYVALCISPVEYARQTRQVSETLLGIALRASKQALELTHATVPHRTTTRSS
jgi:hypothetical protein